MLEFVSAQKIILIVICSIGLGACLIIGTNLMRPPKKITNNSNPIIAYTLIASSCAWAFALWLTLERYTTSYDEELRLSHSATQRQYVGYTKEPQIVKQTKH